MDDMRYTVRDLQWLASRFVDAGVANPNKIAVSGTSMGGALAWNAALLNDRVACGGTAYNTSNGIADPCTGHATGTTVPWRSPDGAAMHIAAAVPLDSWGLLTSALAPNGRTTDGLLGAPAPGNDRSPIGVPQRAWANALNSSAKNSGFLAPAGADPTADWATWLSALGSDDINSVTAAGGTTLGDTLAGAFAQMDDHKSPATDDVGFDAKVPILAIQGLTDSIFSSPQVELMRRKAVAYAASYPIAVSYGNVGHEPATNAADVVTAFNERASAFFDNVLRGVGDPPAYDTEVAPLRCTADVSGNPLSLVAAKSLGALQTGSLTLHAAKTATTRNTGGGSEANKLDPFYDGPYGCTHMSTQTDAGVASWTLTTPSTPAVVMGSPVVTVSGRTTGVDAELNVRLWQITSGTQTLIARGTYRVAGAPSGSNQSFPVQLSGTAWQLAPKSQLKVEVTGFDAPTFAPDSIASVTTIDAVDLRLPTTDLVAIGRGLDDSGQATQQQTFTVARFGDSSTVSHAGDYDATIDWGDGTASAGSIASNNGTLGVSGTHAYANAGDYAVTTTVRSTVSGVSAVENGTASISPPPQPPQQNNPPCRMPHVLHCL
jgi:hypothetical protein